MGDIYGPSMEHLVVIGVGTLSGLGIIGLFVRRAGHRLRFPFRASVDVRIRVAWQGGASSPAEGLPEAADEADAER